MKTVLPGGTLGVLGAGGNYPLFVSAARRMGYRGRVWVPGDDWEDFSAGVDVFAVMDYDASAEMLRRASDLAPVYPSLEALKSVAMWARPVPVERPLAELAVVGARGAFGDSLVYPPCLLDRVGGAIDVVRTPAPLSPRILQTAMDMTRNILDTTDYVGVLGAEFLVTQTREVLVRDVMAGPHIAGLVTLIGSVTDQYEQHLRAVCGLPLGSTDTLRATATAIVRGAVEWSGAYEFPGVKVYPADSGGGALSASAKTGTIAKQIVLAARRELIAQ